jgi:hypothetical protein
MGCSAKKKKKTPGQTTYLLSIKGPKVNMKEIFIFMNLNCQQKENNNLRHFAV